MCGCVIRPAKQEASYDVDVTKSTLNCFFFFCCSFLRFYLHSPFFWWIFFLLGHSENIFHRKLSIGILLERQLLVILIRLTPKSFMLFTCFFLILFVWFCLRSKLYTTNSSQVRNADATTDFCFWLSLSQQMNCCEIYF